MSRVFISYRRSDSQDVAGRVYDRLALHLSRPAVFKDVDNLPAGDFVAHLTAALADCAAVVVLIGPSFFGCRDASGRRRLHDDPDDVVRSELVTALNLGVPIVPVAVSQAVLPSADDWPEGLRALARMNGVVLRADPDFNRDIDRLLALLAPLLGGHVRAEIEQRRQAAASLRDRMTALGWQFSHLVQEMGSGNALIEASAHIVAELERRLGASQPLSKIATTLDALEGLGPSLAVVGWNLARQPAVLDQSRVRLREACADLGGHLALFQHLVALLDGIWDDGHSPRIFVRILRQMPLLIDDDLQTLAERHGPAMALNERLRDVALTYYSRRFLQAARLLDRVVGFAVLACRALGDDDLLALALAAPDESHRQRTHTLSVLALLDGMAGRLSETEITTMKQLAGAIEVAVSKEAAA